ncbi:hypothetical protein NC652_028761 [Populus alba x Populus x berolinensis]|nr:hypothetical protein NC652_028761 [Populus alba x Populus x berolinensis]
MSGPPDSSTMTQLAGPPQFNPEFPTLTLNFGSALLVVKMSSEMEKALLQQVMSLTPEQINLLPPEQRNQVLQLQQMLRQ